MEDRKMHHQIWRKARMCFAAQELYEEKCSEAIFTNNFLSWGNLTEVKDDDSVRFRRGRKFVVLVVGGRAAS